MNKKTIVTTVIVIVTLVLGSLALYSAWRISKLTSTAPEKSKAANTTDSCEITSFTITRIVESPSPSPTEIATLLSSPTPTPTESPLPTESPTNAPTSTPTPTATPESTNTPTNSPSPTQPPLYSTNIPSPTTTARVSVPSTDSGIPQPGTPLPTYVFLSMGLILIITAIALAL